MRGQEWRRLGLSEDEWMECCLAAREIQAATGAPTGALDVAAEFARARAADAQRLIPLLADP